MSLYNQIVFDHGICSLDNKFLMLDMDSYDDMMRVFEDHGFFWFGSKEWLPSDTPEGLSLSVIRNKILIHMHVDYFPLSETTHKWLSYVGVPRSIENQSILIPSIVNIEYVMNILSNETKISYEEIPEISMENILL